MIRYIKNTLKNLTRHKKTMFIVAINVLIISIALFTSFIYVHNRKKNYEDLQKRTFAANIDSMGMITSGFMYSQQESCNSWANYIVNHNLTRNGAIDYIEETLTSSGISAHLIDANTHKGYSTEAFADGAHQVAYNKAYNKIFDSIETALADEKDPGAIYMTQSYTNPVTGLDVVAFYNKVRLSDWCDYYLLRLVPVDLLEAQWTFPSVYQDAELAMITLDGDYIIRPKSMSNENFWDYLFSYNTSLGWPIIDNYKEIAQQNNNVVIELNNKHQMSSYYVVSHSVNNPTAMYVGYIPVSKLGDYNFEYTILLIALLAFFLIIAVDGAYLSTINHELLIHKETAVEASKAKTRFLSSMSHDIRTPMNAIIGMTTIATNNIDNKEQVSDCLTKINSASHHLLTLVNDILDISKIESGKMTLNPSAFNLNELIENLTNIVKPQIKSKNLNFAVNVHDITHENLYADELRINQVFSNLLSNAVKYTNENGNITVEVFENTKNTDSKHIELTYIVADDGLGMSEEFQQKMYDTFTRVNDTRIDKIQGSGLGLSITKEMVDLLEGTIDCQSTLGEGTTFIVKLILEITEIETKVDENPDFSGCNLLVAEDNDMNWEIISEILSYYEITSTRAENGQICVDMLNEATDNTYDAILMDIQMPIMNGREATRQIRKFENITKRNIPIIAMTADAFAEDIQKCLEAGMNDHVAKPVELSKLTKALFNAGLSAKNK